MSSVRDPVGVKLRRLRNLRFTDEEQAWLANAAGAPNRSFPSKPPLVERGPTPVPRTRLTNCC
jgi:hypothetical protein